MSSQKIYNEVKNFIDARHPCKMEQLTYDRKFIRMGPNRVRFRFIGFDWREGNKVGHRGIIYDHYTKDNAEFLDYDKEFFKKNKKFAAAYLKAKNEVRKIEKKSLTEFVNSLDDAKDHPYLNEKQIEPNGAKIIDDKLIIPAYSFEFGYHIGYQIIFPKKLNEYTSKYVGVGEAVIRADNKGDGNKINVGHIKNAYFEIKEKNETNSIYICEGFATACTVHQITKCTTLAGFGEASLFPLANHFAEKHPNKKIFVCIDVKKTMKETKENEDNPEIESYEDQIKDNIKKCNFINIYVIIPKPDPILVLNEHCTDFNDYYCLEQERCVEQLKKDSNVEFLIPIGLHGQHCMVYSEQRGLVALPPKPSPEDLIRELATIDYWRNLFPTKKGDINYKEAIHKLINLCSSKKKSFEYEDIENVGTSLHRKKIGENEEKEILVINTGSKIIGEPNPKSTYLKTTVHNNYTYPDPTIYKLAPEPYLKLQEDLSKLNFSNQNMGISLLCWLAIAPFFKSFKFKPHLLLYGLSGSGKSWALDNIVEPYLSNFNYFSSSDVTHAAFQRIIKQVPRPVILDETDDSIDPITFKKFVKSFRTAASEKGGVSHKSDLKDPNRTIQYPSSFIGALASVSPSIDEKQDASRFLNVTFSKQRITEENARLAREMETFEFERQIKAIALGVYAETYKCFNAIEIHYKKLLTDLSTVHRISGQEAKKLARMLSIAKCVVLKDEERYKEYKKTSNNFREKRYD